MFWIKRAHGKILIHRRTSTSEKLQDSSPASGRRNILPFRRHRRSAQPGPQAKSSRRRTETTPSNICGDKNNHIVHSSSTVSTRSAGVKSLGSAGPWQWCTHARFFFGIFFFMVRNRRPGLVHVCTRHLRTGCVQQPTCQSEKFYALWGWGRPPARFGGYAVHHDIFIGLHG